MEPSFKEEKKLWRAGYKLVACFDEAGRGPLAGPVVAAAAVILPDAAKNAKRQNIKLRQVKDSKKLSAQRRGEIYTFIIKDPHIKWGIGIVSEKIIDKINVLEATKLAMQKAFAALESKLTRRIDFLIIDGNFSLDLPRNQKAIIKADEKVFSCSVASIIAKVTRDRIMARLHKKYPEYGFDRHKGYPTKLHKEMLKKYGAAKVHRKTFRPVTEYA